MSAAVNDTIVEDNEVKRDALRGLFNSCSDEQTGLIHYSHLAELLTLVHSPETKADTTKVERVRAAMLSAAIETVTTFSKNAGVDFQAFVRFYNHIQRLGIDLLVLKHRATAMEEGGVEGGSAPLLRTDSERDIEQLANEIYQNFDHELAETRRNILEGQRRKATSTHTDIVSTHENPYKPPGDIDYFTIVMSAEAFQQRRRAACYHVDLTDEIVEALHGHVDDMLSLATLSDSLAAFGHALVDRHDLTAVFAFYKFAHDDTALRTYLMFKKAEYAGIARSARKKYVFARGASYDDFLKERRKCYEEAASKAKAKAEAVVVGIVQEPIGERKGRKTKKKKRWMILYEDALRRIKALYALEGQRLHGDKWSGEDRRKPCLT